MLLSSVTGFCTPALFAASRARRSVSLTVRRSFAACAASSTRLDSSAIASSGRR